MDWTDEVGASLPIEADGDSASVPVDRLRRGWATLPTPVRVLIVVGAVVGLGIVGELIGGRIWGWYARRLSSVDPLDAAFEDLGL
jgi:hypothetical protein